MTVKEAATKYGRSKSTIYRWLKKGTREMTEKNWLIQRVDCDGELIDEVATCAVDAMHAVDAANRVMDFRGNRGGFVVLEELPAWGRYRGYRIPFTDALQRYLEACDRDFEEQQQEWGV